MMPEKIRGKLPFLFVLAVFPWKVLAESSTLADAYIQEAVDEQLECAATIIFLNDGNSLSVSIASILLEDAIQTLVNIGGWTGNEEGARASIMSRLTVRVDDLLLEPSSAKLTEEIELKQYSCVQTYLSE